MHGTGSGFEILGVFIIIIKKLLDILLWEDYAPVAPTAPQDAREVWMLIFLSSPWHSFSSSGKHRTGTESVWWIWLSASQKTN